MTDVAVNASVSLTDVNNRDLVLSVDQRTAYVAIEGKVFAYEVATGALKGEWNVGKKLGGMDVTIDGKYLVAADPEWVIQTLNKDGTTSYTVGVHRLDLATGEVKTFDFAPRSGDYGFYDVATTSNGNVLLTQAASGWVSLKTLNLNTGVFTTLPGTVGEYSVLTSNRNHDKVLVGEASTSSGAIDLFDVSEATPKQLARGGSSGFNRGVQAISSNGAMSANYVYSQGIIISDGNLRTIKIIADDFAQWRSTSSIQGLAFDESGANLFVLDSEAGRVVQVATSTWKEVASYMLGAGPSRSQQQGEFGNNVLVTSDGHYLIVSHPTGAERIDLTIINGTAGNDTLTAHASGGQLYGLAGDDVLNGGAANDTLNGGSGRDTLNGGGGDDTLNGGAGFDTAVFSQTLGGSTISYAPGGTIVVSGTDGIDSLTGIEVLKFGDGQVTLGGDSMVDALYYNQKNADVYSYGIEASEHYEAFGAREGRDPNAFFSSKGYLAANKDVAAAGMNPLDHYRNFGWQEGRDPSAAFDTRLYLLNNKDVADAGINPIEHYLNYGRYEGRAIYAAVGKTIMANGFDAEYYLLSNPDVAAAGTDPWQHYQLYGAKEGRDPNAYFDTSAYLETNKDVAAAGINPLDHYNNYGLREGRDPSAAFDTKAYLAANPDIAGSGLNPFVHFLQYGVYEGRSPQGDNNVSGPRALAEAFVSDTDVALDIGFAHYGSAGHDQGLHQLAIA